MVSAVVVHDSTALTKTNTIISVAMIDHAVLMMAGCIDSLRVYIIAILSSALHIKLCGIITN